MFRSIGVSEYLDPGVSIPPCARPMRGCRKRQRQQDPAAYINRVDTQQRKYRRRTGKSEAIF